MSKSDKKLGIPTLQEKKAPPDPEPRSKRHRKNYKERPFVLLMLSRPHSYWDPGWPSVNPDPCPNRVKKTEKANRYFRYPVERLVCTCPEEWVPFETYSKGYTSANGARSAAHSYIATRFSLSNGSYGPKGDPEREAYWKSRERLVTRHLRIVDTRTGEVVEEVPYTEKRYSEEEL